MGPLEREITSKYKELASSKSNCLLVLICLLFAHAYQCAFGCKKQIGDNFLLLLLVFFFWVISKVKLEYCILLSIFWFQADNITVYERASYLADLLCHIILRRIHPVFTR